MESYDSLIENFYEERFIYIYILIFILIYIYIYFTVAYTESSNLVLSF